MKVFDIRKDGLDEIRRHEGEEITLKGCLGERYIGCGSKEGVLHIEGTPGNALASYLDGATIYVDGNAQDGIAPIPTDYILIEMRRSLYSAIYYNTCRKMKTISSNCFPAKAANCSYGTSKTA